MSYLTEDADALAAANDVIPTPRTTTATRVTMSFYRTKTRSSPRSPRLTRASASTKVTSKAPLPPPAFLAASLASFGNASSGEGG